MASAQHLRGGCRESEHCRGIAGFHTFPHARVRLSIVMYCMISTKKQQGSALNRKEATRHSRVSKHIHFFKSLCLQRGVDMCMLCKAAIALCYICSAMQGHVCMPVHRSVRLCKSPVHIHMHMHMSMCAAYAYHKLHGHGEPSHYSDAQQGHRQGLESRISVLAKCGLNPKG